MQSSPQIETLLIGLVVLSLLFLGAIYLVETNAPDSPTNSTPTTTPEQGESSDN